MIDLSFYQPILKGILYRGTCDIEVREAHKNPKTKKIENTVKVIYSELPCLLSHSSSEKAENYIPEASQNIRLFIDPDIVLPPACRIRVEQDGVVDNYKLSGVANRYPGHQELNLERWDKWA